MKSFVGKLFVLLWLCLPASADTLEGVVVYVADGDTLTLKVDGASHRIRLSEIDTPEMDQPWGKEAKAALVAKVDRAAIKVTVVDTDRYGRKVGKVWLGKRDVNRELVREGHAWVYERYLLDKTLLKDQEAASSAGTGLWHLPEAVPPWQWRARDAN